MAPPRKLELRSSAPEADTLSTELRGRARAILSQGEPNKREHPEGLTSSLRDVLYPFYSVSL